MADGTDLPSTGPKWRAVNPHYVKLASRLKSSVGKEPNSAPLQISRDHLSVADMEPISDASIPLCGL
jgi:hypothetical protein